MPAEHGPQAGRLNEYAVDGFHTERVVLMLADPQFFDLQVNGYDGVNFNDDALTPESMHGCCEALARHGVVGILATFITGRVPDMCRYMRKLADIRQRDPLVKSMVAGFHIEGPFLNPQDGYRGAHDLRACKPPDVSLMEQLLEAAGGLARIVTLAPELDEGLRVTRLLAKRGIAISAGHSNASLPQLEAAIDAGLGFYTHLGNGCPMQMHRHDNIIQRVLSLSGKLWLMFIADGAHIPYFALANYLRCTGLERTIVVTDAVAPAGKGPGHYLVGRWDMVVGDDLVAMAPDKSHLMGSVLPMPNAAQNLMQRAGLSEADVRRLTSENPRKAMKL
jgi:N-acetylglucosamine-6-phosphate deacetylase